MARPQKTGLEYFPLDVDILSDVKVMKLIRRYGNGTAFSIFIALLCRIYKEGYYIKYEEDDTVFHLSVVLNESDEGMISKVIQACLEIGLFDRDMFDQHHVLTSAAIQRRYIAIQQTSRRVAKITQYKCDSVDVSSEETEETAEEIKKVRKKQAKKPQNAEVSPENSAETPIKENKENKTKEKTKPSKTSTTTARVRVCEEFFSEKYEASEDRLEKEIDILESDEEWKTKIMNHFGFSPQKLHEELKKFVESCRLMGKKNHPTYNDLQQHFKFWKDKDKNNDLNNRTDYGTRSHSRYSSGIEHTHLDPRRPAPCPVGTTQADYE